MWKVSRRLKNKARKSQILKHFFKNSQKKVSFEDFDKPRNGHNNIKFKCKILKALTINELLLSLNNGKSIYSITVT